MADDSELVWSSEHRGVCPRCGRPLRRCRCPKESAPDPQALGPVRVHASRRGRKGKTVTLVTGLGLDPMAIADLARQLKQLCGGGGTVRDGEIEIQGDHVERIVDELKTRGFAARRAGG